MMFTLTGHTEEPKVSVWLELALQVAALNVAAPCTGGCLWHTCVCTYCECVCVCARVCAAVYVTKGLPSSLWWVGQHSSGVEHPRWNVQVHTTGTLGW